MSKKVGGIHHSSPSFFSADTYYWGDRHKEVFLFVRRAAQISPMRSANKYGRAPSIHMDSPVVPVNTMRLLNSVVARTTSSGSVLGRRERISRVDALKAVTINGAKQNFLDDKIGSIELGKFADFVILGKDPTQEEVDLMSISVERTYVGGLEIFRSDSELIQ